MFRLALSAAALLVAQGAAAQSQYTVSDIEAHFFRIAAPAAPEYCPENQPCLRKADRRRAASRGSPAREHGDQPGTPEAGFDLLVTFDSGSVELTHQARENLKAFARALLSPSLDGSVFAVSGHTDARGGASANMALSERRALTVFQFLVARGVPSERLRPRGFGASLPRSTDPTAAVNRRVEASLITR